MAAWVMTPSAYGLGVCTSSWSRVRVRERAVTAGKPQLLGHTWLIPGRVLLPVVLKLRQSTQ